MLIALSPTEALRADLARLGRPDAETDDVIHGGAFARWLRVSTVAYRLSQLAADERTDYAHRASASWPVMDSLPGGPEFGAPGPSDRFADALAGWEGELAAPRLVEAVQREVEDMERGGAFSLGYTTLGALRGLVSHDGLAHGVLLVQQGRVARQFGDLNTAVELYEAAAAAADRVSDRELAARAAVGLGVVATYRGNYPEARVVFSRALAVAPPGSPLIGSAHHGLMMVDMAVGDFDAAFSHGWQAFDDVNADPTRRADLLINLATLCQKVGQEYAALRSYRAALTLASISRLRLPALRGAVLAAARLGRRTLVSTLAAETEAEIGRAGQPYECARAWLDLAEVHSVLEDRERAEQCVAHARGLAAEYGYHEIAWRADERAEQLAAAEAAERSDAPATLAAAGTASQYPLADESLVVIARLTALPLAADAHAAYV